MLVLDCTHVGYQGSPDVSKSSQWHCNSLVLVYDYIIYILGLMTHHGIRRGRDHDLAAIWYFFIRTTVPRRTLNIMGSSTTISELASVQYDPLLTLHISVQHLLVMLCFEGLDVRGVIIECSMALLVQDKCCVGVSRYYNAPIAELLRTANCLLITVRSPRLKQDIWCAIISLPKRHSPTSFASRGSHRLRIVNVGEIISLRII